MRASPQSLLLFLVAMLMASSSAIRTALAAMGGDISQQYDASHMACLKKNGLEFIIVRCFHSTGTVDTKAPASLAAAKAAGIGRRDVYHFPCKGKISVEKQLNASVTPIRGQFDTMWFDIESNADPECAWSKTDYNDNCNFVKSLVKTGEAMGLRLGIYASHRTWNNVLVGCVAAPHLPLWYAHYDNKQSFEDWVPYGGWTKPTIKQINDHLPFDCKTSVDYDWWPDFNQTVADVRLH